MSSDPSADRDPVTESLTPRELDTLLLLAEGLSDREIAQRLFIAPSTVKWNNRQIYSKLGVSGRDQAVERARAVGWLGDGEATGPVYLDNPYKGLRPFAETDAADFFGRESLTQALLARLSETDAFSRFLAVVGPSGCGKSSAVNAGLIPALRRGMLPGSDQWHILQIVPGRYPFEELEIALTRLASANRVDLMAQLRRDTRGIIRATRLTLPDDNAEVLLVIDQFEEIYALGQAPDETQFLLDSLMTAATDARTPLRVIITLRADFYDRPLTHLDFGKMISQRTQPVAPMSPEELERAISGPAQRVGATLEPGLVAALVADASRQPGALPTLQYALTEIFDQRQGRTLTLKAYSDSGGALGALARRADKIFLDLSPQEQVAACQIFLRLVTFGEGSEEVRRRAPVSEVLSAAGNAAQAVLDAFDLSRLLTFDQNLATGEATVELAHEAVIREWDRLKNWLEESRSDIHLQSQLSSAAEAWDAADQDDSYLLRGSRLEEFEAWSQASDLVLTTPETRYLEASIARQAQEDRAMHQQREREARLERRSQIFLRGLVAVFALAAAIAIGLSLFAFSERGRANQNATYASSIALAAAADSALANDNPDQAIALAVAANAVSDPPPAYVQRILYDTATSAGVTERLFTELAAIWARLSPDGQRILSWAEPPFSEAPAFTYRDLASGQTLGVWTPEFLSLGDEEINDLAFSGAIFAPNGETVFLAAVSSGVNSGSIAEFEVATGREIHRFDLPEDLRASVESIALSPDGRLLLAGTAPLSSANTDPEPGQIHVWDTATGQIRSFAAPGPEAASAVSALMFSSDGEHALAGYATGEVILWNVNTGEPIQFYEGVTGSVEAVYFTPAGILAASNGEGNQSAVTLWAEDGNDMLRHATFPVGLYEADLSPDGQTLALALVSPQITLFDIQSWQTTGELYGHGTDAFSVSFTPDGQHLLSGSSDRTLRLWRLTNTAQVERIPGLPNVISGLEMSPDGQALLTQEYSGALTLSDLETGTMIRPLGETQNGIRSIAFSPDGRYVASGSSSLDAHQGGCPGPGSDLTLVDVASGEIVWQSHQEIGYINPGVTFSHDGSQILTTDWWCRNTITVWDVASGEMISQWEGHQAPVLVIHVSPDGKWVATGSRDLTAIVWDAASGTVRHTLQHAALVGNLAFSPDSSQLVTSGEDGTLHVWDVASGRENQELTGHTALATSLQFTPDARYLVSSGREMLIKVWDLESGGVVRQFQLPFATRFGSVVTFSPDGKAILMTTGNNAIRQIDLMLGSGELLGWVHTHRYVRGLTCDERDLYRVAPLCESPEP